jgi:hypothetical protein
MTIYQLLRVSSFDKNVVLLYILYYIILYYIILYYIIRQSYPRAQPRHKDILGSGSIAPRIL